MPARRRQHGDVGVTSSSHFSRSGLSELLASRARPCSPSSTSVDAGVDALLDLLALQVLDHRLHAEVAHVERVLHDQAVDLARPAAPSTSFSLASKPTNFTLPASPALCSASSMPNVVDSFGQKMPSTPPSPPSARRAGSRRRETRLGRRAAVLVVAHDLDARELRLDRVEEALLAVRRARRALLVAEHDDLPLPPRSSPGARPRARRAFALSVATKLTWSLPFEVRVEDRRPGSSPASPPCTGGTSALSLSGASTMPDTPCAMKVSTTSICCLAVVLLERALPDDLDVRAPARALTRAGVDDFQNSCVVPLGMTATTTRSSLLPQAATRASTNTEKLKISFAHLSRNLQLVISLTRPHPSVSSRRRSAADLNRKRGGDTARHSRRFYQRLARGELEGGERRRPHENHFRERETCRRGTAEGAAQTLRPQEAAGWSHKVTNTSSQEPPAAAIQLDLFYGLYPPCGRSSAPFCPMERAHAGIPHCLRCGCVAPIFATPLTRSST